MVPASILFITFKLTDAIDILLVALLLYLAYNLLKGTSAISIFIGLALIYFIYIVIRAFELQLLSSIIGRFVNIGVIAVMIVFQQEIRKFLLFLGSSEFLRNRSWKGILKFNAAAMDQSEMPLDIEALVTASFNMSESKTGAIMVVARKSDLKFFINTGDMIDSGLTSRMLENIFYKNSPLHDGAVIIQDNRIIAARCVLPVTEKEIPAPYGLRHRAAVGITENTDAIAVTVSEQTGTVSLTMHGEIKPDLTRDRLMYLLEKHAKMFD
jgi:diadenylate cyclase